MPDYMISYLGTPKSMTPEEGQQHMSEYKQWMASLGEALVSPANPLNNTHVISANGEVTQGGTTSMSGYSVVQAKDYEAALVIAKDCPYLKVGGSIELSEMIKISI